jgi:hypothetical protein
MDRGVGVTIGQRAASAFADGMKMNEIEGEPLLDTNALKALIHLLRMAQVIGDLCILCFTGKHSCYLGDEHLFCACSFNLAKWLRII